MDVETNRALQLKALGDEKRLQVLEMLACCPERVDPAISGQSAGEICCQITGADRINSTISHHLSLLKDAGLIRMVKHGKYVMCSIERDTLRELAAFLHSLADGNARDSCC